VAAAALAAFSSASILASAAAFSAFLLLRSS